MPRFFFDIDDGGVLTRDDEGSEMDDAEQARAEAVAVLPEIARGAVLLDSGRRDFLATVRDEQGRPIFKATLSLAAEWLEPERQR